MRSLIAGGLALIATQLGGALIATQLDAAEIVERPELTARVAALVPVHGRSRSLGEVTGLGSGSDWVREMKLLSLEGVIAPGDAAKLDQAILGRDGERRPFFLVMDSPGGSFVEGIALGKVLAGALEGNGDPLLQGVVVLNGQRCESACAVAFALAAQPRDAGASARYVEQGARLGFHMPFVPTDQQAQMAEISQAMDLTYSIMTEYLTLIANGIAPAALVQNALFYRRPDEFFLLRGGSVTRFMDFVPVVGPVGGTPITLTGLTQRQVLSMCQHMDWSAGRDMLPSYYEFYQNDGTGPDEAAMKDVFAQQGARILGNQNCVVEWLEGDHLGITEQSSCPSGHYTGWCRLTSEHSYQPPPVTGALLAEALGCPAGRLLGQVYEWDQRNLFFEEERPEDYTWEGVPAGWPVQQFDWSGARLLSNVNLRSAPGGDRLAELPEGGAVAVTDCRMTADGQGVWYAVNAGGQSGWVSARYVHTPALDQWWAMPRPVDFQ